MEPTILAACSLDQWALDFQGNRARIIESIVQAKREHGAKIRIGGELEIPGYGCEDHFLEKDTVLHCWDVCYDVLRLTLTPPYDDILVTVGMPVIHLGVAYNCSIFIRGGKLLLIAPKLLLADEGNYRESRWFTAWKQGTNLHEFFLPDAIRELTGQKLVPFGTALLRSEDGYIIGSECCEELWGPLPTSTTLFLQGAHVVVNISGSYFTFGKIRRRVDLLKSATKNGGIYMYANAQGCDGARVYFDGGSMIAMNGNVLCMGSQYSLKEIEVMTATVDLSEVTRFRLGTPSRGIQAERSLIDRYEIVEIPGFKLKLDSVVGLTLPAEVEFHSIEVEIANIPACWLWDYLRRSGARGFFLPLSGGADSSSVLAIVGNMCQLVLKGLQSFTGMNLEVLFSDVKRICGSIPTDAKELCNTIMHTAFLATINNSPVTQERAKHLALEVGSYHIEGSIDGDIDAFVAGFQKMTGFEAPKFKLNGGTATEDLALQNLQARSRMITSYMLAQLLPQNRGKPGYLLVLGSAILDEGLTGYMTKYDCSSADINPIGGIAKKDLKRFLLWAAENLGYSVLGSVCSAVPTAELTPIPEGSLESAQSDEADIGLTFDQISAMSRLRKIGRCGPLSMFKALCYTWSTLSRSEIAVAVKKFFTRYSANRHKMTTLTPALHCEDYSADDNRFDLRPFLYNVKWQAQFEAIDRLVSELET